MKLTRRAVLKAMALAPGFSVVSSALAKTAASSAKPQFTYILLHGMFFMEFQGSQLYAVTPNHVGHEFYERSHGGTLQSLGRDISLNANGGLRPGNVSSFPMDILQFSASVLGGSNSAILPSAREYRCKIIFPLPKAIFALRSDTKDRFVPTSDSLVGQGILSSTGPRVGTITCLQYEPGSDGPYVMSYYAEHPHSASTREVNEALVSAREVCGPKFDLQLPPGFVHVPSPLDAEGALPNGISGEDEASLEELGTISHARVRQQRPASLRYTSFMAADIASCPQFGINHP